MARRVTFGQQLELAFAQALPMPPRRPPRPDPYCAAGRRHYQRQANLFHSIEPFLFPDDLRPRKDPLLPSARNWQFRSALGREHAERHRGIPWMQYELEERWQRFAFCFEHSRERTLPELLADLEAMEREP